MFSNRQDAARNLAARLKGRRLHDPVVLAIPRGGVIIGSILTQELGAELDVVLARKLRAPGQPELAIGALSEQGEVYLNPQVQARLQVSDDYLARERRTQKEEIARRQKLFRNIRPAAQLGGRSVIVTDDGIATGATMIAALNAIRGQQPREIIVAVPVASPDRLKEVRPLCDDVVCLLRPEHFWAIGQFYEDFSQLEDDEVAACFAESNPGKFKGG